ncbi:MAG: flagellar biosynthesis protein FlgL [Bacteroidetes bacterium QH_7_62_13]|nr:MAG: flagellar biosynthesis protein FlgL [Bacteroidetes bacterium QH_7_62_13]
MSSVSISQQRGLYSNITEKELPEIREDISRLREQIGTGKRINRPSDGPTDYSVGEEMGRLDTKIDRRLSTIENAKSFVARTQQEVEGIGDLFAQAQEKGVQAANDTVGDQQREAIADELRSIKDEVVNRLNARFSGEYLFGGDQNQTQPFDEDGSINGTVESIGGDRTRPIGQGQEITTNVSGAELQQYDAGGAGPDSITGALDGLINAVDPNESPDDPTLSADDIRGALDEVSDARDHVFGKAAKAGTISNRLLAAQDQLETTQLNVRERKSNAVDTDIAKAASDLQQKQTQLEAALKVVSKTQQQASLVDYV